MYIAFLDLEIGRRADLDRRVQSLADYLADTRVADRIKLYAHNPECTRAALAAYIGVKPDAIPEGSKLLQWMTRGIEAFAGEMQKRREIAKAPGIVGEAVS